jgi:hypothetical protein
MIITEARGKGANDRKTKLNPLTIFVGTVENAARPEAVHIRFTWWVEPVISMKIAQERDETDYNELAKEIGEEFYTVLMKNKLYKFIKSNIDSKFFVKDSLFFDVTPFPYQSAKPKKRQFAEFEINLETVNDYDYDTDEPIAHTDGNIYDYTFSDFEKELIKFAKIIQDYLKKESNNYDVTYSIKR